MFLQQTRCRTQTCGNKEDEEETKEEEEFEEEFEEEDFGSRTCLGVSRIWILFETISFLQEFKG